LAYEGTARDLVRALKFDAALPLAGLMAAHMAANLPLDLRRPPPPPASVPAPLGPAFGIVPVPPHRGRLRRRGFDPAALLAAGLAARAGLPLHPCLRRADRGRRQVGAGRSTRRSAGRFAAVATAPPPRAAVLVDDVHTTGATLDVCARALKAEGAEWVGAITYVRTL
jgi:predicted amidophosphoribosyltransferase